MNAIDMIARCMIQQNPALSPSYTDEECDALRVPVEESYYTGNPEVLPEEEMGSDEVILFD